MPPFYEHTHTVREDEIDTLGRANNVAYLEWMQAAAIAHSTAQGWSVAAYEELGAGWVVRSHTIEYRKPAFPGDEIVVRTWVATMETATSLRRYHILRPVDGVLLATAETQWVFIDFATGRPKRIPPAMAEAFTVVDR